MAISAHPWLLLFCFSGFFSLVLSDEISLVVGQSTGLEVVPSFPVRDSPGSKPGSVVGAERVHIYGLSRMRNLKKISGAIKVKVSYANSTLRQPIVDVCLHRNFSVAVGMCPQRQWEKLSKGTWVRKISPFDHKLLDVRAVGLSSTVLDVTIEEEFFMYRVVFLILGLVMMTLAPTLSRSLVFYYSSAMTVGIILVILVVLFQGMKLLPTGRRSSLAIFMYSSAVGVGSFILSYMSKFLQAFLVELGISEDIYNPLAVFLVLLVVLGGAWLGFWTVRKLILTEDGSVDTNVSQFVAWSMRILAGVMILLCSLDPILASVALMCAIVVSTLLRRAYRPKLLHHFYWKILSACESSVFPSGFDDDVYSFRSYGSQDKLRPGSRPSSLASCTSSGQGLSKSTDSRLSDSETFYSAFHSTPERKKFSKDEWDEFTRDSTRKALKELMSSPEFSKWAVANAERITLTPTKKKSSETHGWRSLFIGRG